jgi:YVTN family beta-propeller protein
MNIKNTFIVLSISLLISSHMLDAAPFVYVANSTGSSFSVIDQATGTLVSGSPFAVPNSANLLGVAISTDNKTAYMIDDTNTTLLAIDTATNSIVSTTDLSGLNFFSPAAIAIDGTTAYIAGGNLLEASLLPVNIADPSAPIVGSSIALTNASGLDFHEVADLVISNHVAYITVNVFDFFQSVFAYTFYAVDLSTMSQAYYQSPIPDNSTPLGVAIDTATDTAYVVFNDSNAVQPFNFTPAPAGYPIPVGSSPVGIAITSDNHYAYVTNNADNSVSVIDLTLPTPSVTTTIMGVSHISPKGQNIAISLDNTTVYVANADNHTVTPITVGSSSAGTPIPVGGSALSLAVTGQVILSPTNVVGVRKNNVFLLQTARYLTITWTASADAVSYNIYNGTTLVGNVLATSPLTFDALLASGDNGNNYFVTAIDSLGGESTPVPVVIA